MPWYHLSSPPQGDLCPRNVRHTAPLLTAGRRAPALFGLLLRSVIPPTRAARLSPARALLEPSFEVLLSLMAFICPHCSRISPACQEFCPGSRLSYGKRRKSDKPSAAAHDRPPVFFSPPGFPHRRSFSHPAPDFLSPGFFPLRHSTLLLAARRPPNRRTTTRRTADAVFTGATKHPAQKRRVFCGSPFTK